jgi:hypothetical protein
MPFLQDQVEQCHPVEQLDDPFLVMLPDKDPGVSRLFRGLCLEQLCATGVLLEMADYLSVPSYEPW